MMCAAKHMQFVPFFASVETQSMLQTEEMLFSGRRLCSYCLRSNNTVLKKFNLCCMFAARRARLKKRPS